MTSYVSRSFSTIPNLVLLVFFLILLYCKSQLLIIGKHFLTERYVKLVNDSHKISTVNAFV